jgi:hypothetical protein
VTENKESLDAKNYCISFIDLLGQRSEYRNEGLLPAYQSVADKELFKRKVQRTIGRVHLLQRISDTMLKAALAYKSPAADKLPSDVRHIYDEIKEVRLKRQRWSDGLVSFVSLADGDVKCPMCSVYTLLVTIGGVCFLMLAEQLPIRGAIDIAWGVELHEGEIYGPAVAKAYELESEVAQYPRIVVGPLFVDYLVSKMKDPAADIYAQCNRGLAKLCYDMLARDSDGYHFVDYLGETFHKTATGGIHQRAYQDSMKFIHEQCDKWSRERNTKLAFRYNRLLSYFVAHPPPVSQQRDADVSAPD